MDWRSVGGPGLGCAVAAVPPSPAYADGDGAGEALVREAGV